MKLRIMSTRTAPNQNAKTPSEKTFGRALAARNAFAHMPLHKQTLFTQTLSHAKAFTNILCEDIRSADVRCEDARSADVRCEGLRSADVRREYAKCQRNQEAKGNQETRKA